MFGAENDSCVLIVDDERDQYELIKLILSMEGYSAITADNVNDAIRLSKKFHPFVIISDFSMPDLNGAELIKCVRSDGGRDIPIIILSASSPDYIKKRLHPGFFPDAILSKPVDFNELLDLVKNFSDTPEYVSQPTHGVRRSPGLVGY